MLSPRFFLIFPFASLGTHTPISSAQECLIVHEEHESSEAESDGGASQKLGGLPALPGKGMGKRDPPSGRKGGKGGGRPGPKKGEKVCRGCNQSLPESAFPAGKALCHKDQKAWRNLINLSKAQNEESWLEELREDPKRFRSVLAAYHSQCGTSSSAMQDKPVSGKNKRNGFCILQYKEKVKQWEGIYVDKEYEFMHLEAYLHWARKPKNGGYDTKTATSQFEAFMKGSDALKDRDGPEGAERVAIKVCPPQLHVSRYVVAVRLLTGPGVFCISQVETRDIVLLVLPWPGNREINSLVQRTCSLNSVEVCHVTLASLTCCEVKDKVLKRDGQERGKTVTCAGDPQKKASVQDLAVVLNAEHCKVSRNIAVKGLCGNLLSL